MGAAKVDLILCCASGGKLLTVGKGGDTVCGCVIVLQLSCIEVSGMLNAAGNDSSLHRDVNCAAKAMMLSLRGRSSSSNKEAYMSLLYCAIATSFAFASLLDLQVFGA